MDDTTKNAHASVGEFLESWQHLASQSDWVLEGPQLTDYWVLRLKHILEGADFPALSKQIVDTVSALFAVLSYAQVKEEI